MNSQERGYTLGWVEDCLNVEMDRKQQRARQVDGMEAETLWAEIQGLARMQKVLALAAKKCSAWMPSKGQV